MPMKTVREYTWLDRLRDEIKLDEGFVAKVYLDTVGVKTAGYGHTGDLPEVGVAIDPALCDKWLAMDLAEAVDDARAVFKGFELLNDPRKVVLANMAFNLGRKKLGQFVATLGHVADKNFDKAAAHMLKSLWARQVKGRARRLAAQMRSGQYQKLDRKW
jgi:lysozyme